MLLRKGPLLPQAVRAMFLGMSQPSLRFELCTRSDPGNTSNWSQFDIRQNRSTR